MLKRNGILEETGVAAGVLDSRVQGIVWLARRLAPYGIALGPGQLIVVGLVYAPGTVSSGRHFRSRFSRPGEVTLNWVLAVELWVYAVELWVLAVELKALSTTSRSRLAAVRCRITWPSRCRSRITNLNLCDTIGAHDQARFIERGLGRHGVSNAYCLYLRDDDGHRI